MKGLAVHRGGAIGDADVVGLAGFQRAGRGEDGRVGRGPAHGSGDGRLDGEGGLDRGLIHRLVEADGDGRVGGHFLAGQRIAGDDLGRPVDVFNRNGPDDGGGRWFRFGRG